MAVVQEFKLQLPAFLLAFAFGMLVAYVLTPPVTYIDKYPTPFDVERILYTDLTQGCYKFRVEEATCAADALPQPVTN